MNQDTLTKLLTVNRQFYQNLGKQFSNTRNRIQPGVRRIFAGLPADDKILDLGCGNGELAAELEKRGHTGLYVGLDLSQAMLTEARQRNAGLANSTFLQVDLVDPGWVSQLEHNLNVPNYLPVDLICAFAVLHHIPGEALRLQLLHQVRRLISPSGRFVHSAWQFLNSPRLRARIQPWHLIDLTDADVEPGDYLLDWRHGGYGLRYVHHFSENELAYLAEQAGFSVTNTFFSDGEGGRLGLYQTWGPHKRV